MNREESFVEAIRKAEEAAKREWLAGLPMAEWWEQIREDVVRPIFNDAVNALVRREYKASQRDKNGKGIILQAGSPVLNLEFTLDGENISLASSASDIKPAVYDRNHITEEDVTIQVNKFLEIVAKQTVLKGKQDR